MKFFLIFCVFLIISLTILAVIVLTVNSKTKSDTDNSDAQTNSSVKALGDSKDFFPCEEFYPYAFGLGQQEYRAIIEVGSINYDLLSPSEQDIIDMSYQSFLNSLNFPIEIYVQTTEFDNIQMQSILHEDIKKSVELFPSISNYALAYEENMKELTNYLGNSKIKKKYVIVPYSSVDFSDVSSLSESEVVDFALEELHIRASVVMNGLNACNLETKLLNKSEIAEVLYAYYHRDYSHIAQDIIGGQYSDVILTGKKRNTTLELDSILAGAENQIRTSLTKAASSEEQKLYRYIIEILGDLRKNTSPMNTKELLDLSREMAKKERYKTYGTQFVGEPTEEDYIQAFNLQGSGVKKEDIKDYVEEHYQKQSTTQSTKEPFWMNGIEDEEGEENE